MDSQAAKELVESQPGKFVNEREEQALDVMRKKEDIAKTDFYKTIASFGDYYYGRVVHDGERNDRALSLNDVHGILYQEADREERREAFRTLNVAEERVMESEMRTRSLSRYIADQRQRANGDAHQWV
tara:strand:+ start:546 stop:929 length:384 start_codon:yes stop_codon:yes gene_type:complete